MRDSVARPASSPARTNERGEPFSPRAVIHNAPATSGWNRAKLSGWAMNATDNAGMAIRTPAPTATTALAPASRAIAQVSGAAVAPIRTKGAADAHGCGPNRARNGTWTSAASGIQWPNAAIGRVGSAGMAPPTSGKIHTTSTLNPLPCAIERAAST